MMTPPSRFALRTALLSLVVACAGAARAQMTDITQAPNALNAGIQKSFAAEVGPGRGDESVANSSLYLIRRDPFRSIARGRSLFQRKFTGAQGLGPRRDDGQGDIGHTAAIGAGLSDSCASCHGRPFGSAGVGGNVFTRPESRDAPHLFGLGLKEMLADEITAELRSQRRLARIQAQAQGSDVQVALVGKGVHYGSLVARADGTLDTSGVQGIDADLRVRPFFAQGKTISIREFIVGALDAEMGLQAVDPDLLAASQGAEVTTPAGMRLDGRADALEAPSVSSATQDGDADGVVNEVPTSAVDHLEFYLLNYFKPGTGRPSAAAQRGRGQMSMLGCTQCHVPDFIVENDRRVADVVAAYDPARSNPYSSSFATAVPRFDVEDDGSGLPSRIVPRGGSFRVRDIFTDFKRHDLGPAFHERNFDGTTTTQFLTSALWGVGSTAPYGHDGRSLTLHEVILRHGGEAQAARDAYAQLAEADQDDLRAFLATLVLFSPPDTASNLAPADPSHPNWPIAGHGSIDLSVLFRVPSDKE